MRNEESRLGLATVILSGLALGGGRTLSFSLGRFAGGSIVDGVGVSFCAGLGVLDVGVGAGRLRLPETIPFSVASLYFLILAVEMREVKWKTDTEGFGAAIMTRGGDENSASRACVTITNEVRTGAPVPPSATGTFKLGSCVHRGSLAYLQLYMAKTGRSGSDGDGHRWHDCMMERGRKRSHVDHAGKSVRAGRQTTRDVRQLHVPGGQRSVFGSTHPERAFASSHSSHAVLVYLNCLVLHT